MQRILKHRLWVPRARPPMRRGLKLATDAGVSPIRQRAARAAPYEKGTETHDGSASTRLRPPPRARPPMRRGLKLGRHRLHDGGRFAARAAPYEKGTETGGTEVCNEIRRVRRARGPL